MIRSKLFYGRSQLCVCTTHPPPLDTTGCITSNCLSSDGSSLKVIVVRPHRSTWRPRRARSTSGCARRRVRHARTTRSARRRRARGRDRGRDRGRRRRSSTRRSAKWRRASRQSSLWREAASCEAADEATERRAADTRGEAAPEATAAAAWPRPRSPCDSTTRRARSLRPRRARSKRRPRSWRPRGYTANSPARASTQELPPPGRLLILPRLSSSLVSPCAQRDDTTGDA